MVSEYLQKLNIDILKKRWEIAEEATGYVSNIRDIAVNRSADPQNHYKIDTCIIIVVIIECYELIRIIKC